MGSGFEQRQHFNTGATTVPLDTPEATAIATGIWHRDPNVWKPGDADAAIVIKNRLGWLDVIGAMHEQLPALKALAIEVREAGWRDCIVHRRGLTRLDARFVRLSPGRTITWRSAFKGSVGIAELSAAFSLTAVIQLVAINAVAILAFGERLGRIEAVGVALAIVSVALITLGPALSGP